MKSQPDSVQMDERQNRASQTSKQPLASSSARPFPKTRQLFGNPTQGVEEFRTFAFSLTANAPTPQALHFQCGIHSTGTPFQPDRRVFLLFPRSLLERPRVFAMNAFVAVLQMAPETFDIVELGLLAHPEAVFVLDVVEAHPVVGVRWEWLAADIASIECHVRGWRGGRRTRRVEARSGRSDTAVEILDLVAGPEHLGSSAGRHVISVFIDFLSGVETHTRQIELELPWFTRAFIVPPNTQSISVSSIIEK